MGVKLHERQLFSMNQKNLEKRFLEYYEETKDANYIIECALVVQIRNGLTTEDFSFFAKDFVRELFFTGEDLQATRHLCFFFRAYFSNEEWAMVIGRLFEKPEEYLDLTQHYVPGVEKVQPLLSSGGREEKEDISLRAVFEDANGKQHTWRLRNAERKRTSGEGYELMYILSFLTILQKDGIRRFVKPLRSTFLTTYQVEHNKTYQPQG